MKHHLILFTIILSFFTFPITAQWTSQSSGTSDRLRSVFFINANNGWAVGDVGTIIHTTNGGTNWTSQSGTGALKAVCFVSENIGWAVGGEHILKTTNGGTNWADQEKPVTGPYTNCYFLDANTGWASGATFILWTTNGGTKWNLTDLSGITSIHIKDLYFFNTTIGWAVSFEDIILKTTDGGLNWSQQNSNTSFSDFEAVQFIDANNGWVVGHSSEPDGKQILKTTNGGSTWTAPTTDIGTSRFDLCFIDGNNGVVVGNGGNMEYTSDGGTNWTSQSNTISNTLHSVYFIDASTGWAVGDGGVIIKNDDAGLPVELSSFKGYYYNNRVNLFWRTETEVNNYGFEIKRSTDNIIWETLGFVEGHGNSNSPKEYEFIDLNIGLSDRYYYRLKQIDNDGTFEYSNVVAVNVGIPNQFNLSQNYPNPFNPTTTIKYQIPELSFVTLKIYDVLGNEITNLVNEEKSAGSYEVDFNATTLPSGIYFYKLQAGNFVETKKMVLLK